MTYALNARQRARQRRYNEQYRLDRRALIGEVTNVTVPHNIEVRHVHEPCFLCGTGPAPCRHRVREFA